MQCNLCKLYNSGYPQPTLGGANYIWICTSCVELYGSFESLRVLSSPYWQLQAAAMAVSRQALRHFNAGPPPTMNPIADAFPTFTTLEE